MVFKHFRFNIIVRVLLLTLALSLLAWCIVIKYYLRSFYVGTAAVLILVDLIWYIDRFNRDVRTFMLSLLQSDFTTRYDNSGKGKSFNALYDVLNRISAAFEKISAEKEIQHRYLEMLVDHVQVGILSFDKSEKVHLVNNALKKLLQRKVIMRLDVLSSIDNNLYGAVREIKAGQTRLVRIKLGSELLQLSLHAAEFKLDDEDFKLISFQNIRSELDARDMEAWQKLIRVMTHEIMNSISPITSLSGTLHNLVKEQEKSYETIPVFKTLDQGLDAIRVRSEGLNNFTEAYRRLTRIPTPNFKETNVKVLLQRIYLLLEKELKEKNISLEIHATDTLVLLDEQLMQQVFINLIRNAIDAVSSVTGPLITISQIVQPDGKTIITITDNGHGMDAETMDNIFVPFYTTKRNGSGIGLALTRQILHLHHAEIKVTSVPEEGSTFVIHL